MKFYDRVLETSTTVGLSTYTLLGTLPSYQSFSKVGNGNTCFYTAYNSDDWEVGVGTYNSNTLTRDRILDSSNSGNKVNWGVGTRYIILVDPAEHVRDAQIIKEIPSGSCNGSNNIFTLANIPKSGTVEVYLNGLFEDNYSIVEDVITLQNPPMNGDKVRVNYRKDRPV